MDGGSCTVKELEEEISAQKTIQQVYSTVLYRSLETFRDIFDLNVRWGFRLTVKMTLSIFANEVSQRATSKSEDEALCFAAILGLNVRPILEVPSDKRMEKFYDLVESLPSEFIFHDFPRLETPGYRWAPKSFISQSHNLITVPNTRLWENKPPDAMIIPGSGVFVMFPGAHLHPHTTGPHLGNQFIFAPENSKLRFLIRLQADPESGKYLNWETNTQYLMISFEKLNKSSPPSEALLVTFHSKYKDGRMAVVPVARARIELFRAGIQDSNSNNKNLTATTIQADSERPVSGFPYNRKQTWCLM